MKLRRKYGAPQQQKNSQLKKRRYALLLAMAICTDCHIIPSFVDGRLMWGVHHWNALPQLRRATALLESRQQQQDQKQRTSRDRDHTQEQKQQQQVIDGNVPNLKLVYENNTASYTLGAL